MHNDGQWTDARYHSFIKSALRAASNRWPPKWAVRSAARVERGIYLCAGHNRRSHRVKASLPPSRQRKRRINNAEVDHIQPIIDPKIGFVGWDTVIKRMFCEADGLQLLCHECHKQKTKDERKKK